MKMPIKLNSLLLQEDVDPAGVILLRHQDKKADPGRTPYKLWCEEKEAFERYQSIQSPGNRKKFSSNYWLSFVATPQGETMFVGLYTSRYCGLNETDLPWTSVNGSFYPTGSCDCYDLTLDKRLSDLSGRLFIEWGPGFRSWIQRAQRQNKDVIEVRPEFSEPEFPGFINFVKPLSEVESLPKSWEQVLSSSRGVYLLTCPHTKEQYVGSAYGEKGFWHRWMEYVGTGHGGNVALKSRELSDYQISILEVAGSAETTVDILKMEALWKSKLQSQKMGLNRN
jgi:hypothetical protein